VAVRVRGPSEIRINGLLPVRIAIDRVASEAIMLAWHPEGGASQAHDQAKRQGPADGDLRLVHGDQGLARG
jgi:hypothetical protein